MAPGGQIGAGRLTGERGIPILAVGNREAHTATHCHLGNIAYWLKRPLKWDSEKEEIIGDPEANRWLDRPKREPYNLL
ncbi:hypothetical protein HQ576_14765 [bacterium]|nr:hypothetical protein [bacterium]